MVDLSGQRKFSSLSPLEEKTQVLLLETRNDRLKARLQGWKFMSCSHGQELGQLADLASDWLLCSQLGASLLVDTTHDNDYNS